MTIPRFAAWLLAALAFPPAGLIARAIAGPADSLQPALLSGAIAGAIIGLAYGLVLHGRDLPRVGAWVAATAAGLAVGLGVAAMLVGIPEPGTDVLAMGIAAGVGVGVAQALVHGGTSSGRAAWAALITVSWTLGWWVTATVGVDLGQGWPIFGATGAITAQLISGMAMLGAERVRSRAIARPASA